MQPQNGIIGDTMGIDLPTKQADEEALNNLKNKAKYKRSKEYAELKEKADARIEFYQKFLPNGLPIGGASAEEMKGKWELANLLIAEFKQLFDEYEGAEELLKETYGE